MRCSFCKKKGAKKTFMRMSDGKYVCDLWCANGRHKPICTRCKKQVNHIIFPGPYQMCRKCFDETDPFKDVDPEIIAKLAGDKK